jgi:hypothetical protein
LVDAYASVAIIPPQSVTSGFTGIFFEDQDYLVSPFNITFTAPDFDTFSPDTGFSGIYEITWRIDGAVFGGGSVTLVLYDTSTGFLTFLRSFSGAFSEAGQILVELFDTDTYSFILLPANSTQVILDKCIITLQRVDESQPGN